MIFSIPCHHGQRQIQLDKMDQPPMATQIWATIQPTWPQELHAVQHLKIEKTHFMPKSAGLSSDGTYSQKNTRWF